MNYLPVTPEPSLAYLAQGKIRIKVGDKPPQTVDSAYGNTIRERAVRAQQKNSWKSGGDDGSPFKAALWGKSAGGSEVPLAITSICAGREPASIIYSLESGSLCALLEVTQMGADERRLWNDNKLQIRHVSVSREAGDMVFSILHQNGTANIGVKLAGHSGIQELTEGDSFDTAPRWRLGAQGRIVFQSAGIGRNREGHFLALGAFCIQELDTNTSELTTLLENSKYDYLAPQSLRDGTLLYIKRPYSQHARINPFRLAKDIVLFPFRLLYALFQYLNFFSSIYTGKKLTSTGGGARNLDMKQMMIWGNLVRAEQHSAPEEEGADLVPKSWQLCSRNSAGQEKVLGSGVLAYDVNEGGYVVFTNGNAIFTLSPDGKKKQCVTEAMIEQVFFVSTSDLTNPQT